MKPLAKWDKSDEEFPPGLIWFVRLDNKYQIEVQASENPDIGHLVIFDHNEKDKMVHMEPVTLSYGAMFGPDVMDVAEWQRRCVNIVDGLS